MPSRWNEESGTGAAASTVPTIVVPASLSSWFNEIRLLWHWARQVADAAAIASETNKDFMWCLPYCKYSYLLLRVTGESHAWWKSQSETTADRVVNPLRGTTLSGVG